MTVFASTHLECKAAFLTDPTFQFKMVTTVTDTQGITISVTVFSGKGKSILTVPDHDPGQQMEFLFLLKTDVARSLWSNYRIIYQEGLVALQHAITICRTTV